MAELFDSGYMIGAFMFAGAAFALGYIMGRDSVMKSKNMWSNLALEYATDAAFLHRQLRAAVAWGLKLPPKGCRAKAAHSRNAMEKSLVDALESMEHHYAGK